MRLSQAIDEYVVHAKALNYSRSTLSNINDGGKMLLAGIGDRCVQDITARDIEEYLIYLREYVSRRTGKPLAASTVGVRLAFAHALFNLLVERGYIDKNPAQGIKPREESDELIDRAIPLPVLTAAIKYVIARKNYRVLLMFVALADSALRRGEVVRLRIPDIDIQRRVMLVNRRKARRKQYVPLSDTFIWAYTLWMTQRPKVGHDYVFTMPLKNNAPLNPNGLSESIGYFTRYVCGKKWRPHSIRHAWISEAVNRAGISVATVQRVAGHSQTAMTMNYVRHDMEAEREAVEQQILLHDIAPELTGNGTVLTTSTLDYISD